MNTHARILNKGLSKWLEMEENVCDKNNVFRPQGSCLYHIYSLHSLIKMSLSDNNQVSECSVDCCKTF